MKLNILAFCLIFLYACSVSKPLGEVELKFKPKRTKTGIADLEIINHTSKEIVLLDVFSDNKLRDINFFLPLKERFLEETVIQNSKNIYLGDSLFRELNESFIEDTSCYYYCKDIDSLALLKWGAKKIELSNLIIIPPFNHKVVKYIFDEDRTFYDGIKSYPIDKKLKYSINVKYKGNSKYILEKGSEELRLFINYSKRDVICIYNGEIFSNNIKIVKNKRSDISSIFRRKKYWYHEWN